MQSVVSIDIGGTLTKLARIDRAFNILENITLKTQSFTNETDYFRALFSATTTLMAKAKDPNRVIGIGIGAPCGIPDEGIIYQAANLPFSDRVEIVKRFHQHFNSPVFLTKDSYAATLGEGAHGAAKKMSNYILLTLGTGLGCGIVINNKLVTGHNGQAGELGHTVSIENGRSCKCGKKGCLETYVSATGLKRTVFSLLAKSNEDSVFRSLSFQEVSAKMVYEAALKGDSLAKSAFDFTGKLLGNKLADLVSLFEPEAIFIAGGLANAGQLLIKPLKEQLNAQLLNIYRDKVKILPSSLGTNEAALLGAASIVWEKLNTNSTCLS